MNVLLVEDDPRIAAVVQQALVEAGHHVEAPSHGGDAVEHMTSIPYDIAVLDLMLPQSGGFHILERVRRTGGSVPILVLSARDGAGDIVRALDLGADDYVTKPFSLDMLLARMRAVSRRGPVPSLPRLSIAGVTLDPAKRMVCSGERAVSLTRREFALLELLMRRAGSVVSRTQLTQAGWGLGAEPSKNSLEFYIHSLRSKLCAPGERSLIQTVRAMGYRFG